MPDNFATGFAVMAQFTHTPYHRPPQKRTLARDFKQTREDGWDKRPRTDGWDLMPTTNEAFVEYYKAQGIVPEEVRFAPAAALPPPPPFLGRRRRRRRGFFQPPTSVA
jgi:hypothetical protein